MIKNFIYKNKSILFKTFIVLININLKLINAIFSYLII